MKLGINAFTAGIVVATIVVALGLAVLRPWEPERFSFELTANGADMSRHGVAKLAVADDDGRHLVVAQTCNGSCDDLALKLKVGGDDGALVDATDASGRSVAHSGAYLTNGAVARLTLVGTDKLEFRYDDEVYGY